MPLDFWTQVSPSKNPSRTSVLVSVQEQKHLLFNFFFLLNFFLNFFESICLNVFSVSAQSAFYLYMIVTLSCDLLSICMDLN